MDYYHMAFKLFVFQVINSYLSLIYIGFLKQNMDTCYDNDCGKEVVIQILVIYAATVFTTLLQLIIP